MFFFLWLVLNSLRKSWLNWMYMSLIVNTRSSLIHLGNFHLLVLLLKLTEMTSFICTNRVNLRLKPSSDMLVIVPKGLL